MGHSVSNQLKMNSKKTIVISDLFKFYVVDAFGENQEENYYLLGQVASGIRVVEV